MDSWLIEGRFVGDSFQFPYSQRLPLDVSFIPEKGLAACYKKGLFA